MLDKLGMVLQKVWQSPQARELIYKAVEVSIYIFSKNKNDPPPPKPPQIPPGE